MNIKNELLVERSKLKINEVAHYIKINENRLPDLVNLLKSEDDFLRYRVSWCLSTCYDLKIKNIAQYCNVYMFALGNETSSSVKRNLLRVLQWVKVPEMYHGNLINYCFEFVNDVNEPIAVKAFSLGILEKMCSYYPELINELLLLCDEQKLTNSPGIKSRINRIHKIFG